MKIKNPGGAGGNQSSIPVIPIFHRWVNISSNFLIWLIRVVQLSQSSPYSAFSSSSFCSHSYHGNGTSPHSAIVIAKITHPHKPCASRTPGIVFWVLTFVCCVRIAWLCVYVFMCVCVCAHTLTIRVTKFLKCTAHGCLDSQVPPFRAHGGRPGKTGKEQRKKSSFVKHICKTTNNILHIKNLTRAFKQ